MGKTNKKLEAWNIPRSDTRNRCAYCLCIVNEVLKSPKQKLGYRIKGRNKNTARFYLRCISPECYKKAQAEEQEYLSDKNK